MAKAQEKAFPASDIFRPLWPALKRALPALPLLVCIGLFAFHFSVIHRYAVNIPNMDDWRLFDGESHPASVDLPWLHALTNEHRTATTKLFVWLQFQLNGWDIRTHYLIDFMIFGLFLTFLTWAAKRWASDLPTWVISSFIVFLLSPIIWLNHYMAYPVAVHFWVFFFFIAAYLLFANRQSWPALIVGCLASSLSIYSFASGFVASLVLLLVFSVFKYVRFRELRDQGARRRELRQLLLVTLLIGGALATWILGFRRPSYHPPLAFPYRRVFWSLFLNLVSFGFGIDRVSGKIGLVCLLIILAPIGGSIWKQRGKLSIAQWATFAIVLAILADLAVISLGRAGFDFSFIAKDEEYAEHGMPLIVLSLINWSIFLRDRRTLRAGAIAALWIFCLIAFQNNWDFDIYRRQSALRLEGERCVKAYYQQVGDGRCPTICPASPYFISLLEQAKRLNASFYQDAIKANRKTSSGRLDYLGAHGDADCNHISGWAYDRSDPDAIVVVAIYDGDSLLKTVPAYMFQPGLLQAGFGTGLYGFEFATPPSLKDGRPHSVLVQFAATRVDLLNTPKVLTCTPP
jgi:hypothetical protein